MSWSGSYPKASSSRRGAQIETARLRLRSVSMADLDAMHGLWTDPRVRRYLWDGEIISRHRARAAIEDGIESLARHGFGLWVAQERTGEALIGFCGPRYLDEAPGVGVLYGISPPFWGCGLATEVALAVIRYGFEEVGVDRIEASADTPNAASLRVIEKAGMAYEKRELLEGQDLTYYAISREDFLAATGLSAGPG